MWKKGAYFLFGAYVLISLCEWASRLAFGVDHSMLTFAWSLVQPVLLFVYSMGEWAHELVKMVRLEDGVASFAATFFFFTRLILGPLDFFYGLAGFPFYDFVPRIFSFETKNSIPLMVLTAASGLLVAIIPAMAAHSFSRPKPTERADSSPCAEPTAPSEPAHAEPAAPSEPVRRGRAKKE